MAHAPGQLYFVASRRGAPRIDGGEVHCLVRVNTPVGAPHVACLGRPLGERWIDLMGVSGQACLVAAHELTALVSFDVESYGVLVFRSDADLGAYLVDADGFDYRSRISRPALEVSSGEPW
jgi:hypothetical protein